MTRGFVTIATGNDWYYRIACNLLKSYRLFSDKPMPFAIICDRNHPLISGFDQVILLDHAFCSYLDKLRLLELLPFDETVFIDADCLAFRDLNDFWDAFENASDFSAFGTDYPIDYPYAWFQKNGAGEFADQINTIPDFIGGVYFLRKTPHLAEMYNTCQHILKNYHQYCFRQFENPADEPIFALAMSVHGDRTVGNKSLPVCFYPHAVRFSADICKGMLCYDSRYSPEKGLTFDGYMVHWGAGNTRKPLYLLEEYKLKKW